MIKCLKKTMAVFLVVCLFLQTTNCLVLAQENESITEVETTNTQQQSVKNFAIPAGLYFIPGIGEVLVEATGAIIVAGAVIAVGSWLYDTIVDWFTSGKAFNKSADDAIDDLDNNSKIHIMDKKHNWNKLDKDPKGPKWEVVAGILKETLKKGEETLEKNDIYIRTLIYKGETVVVRFRKGANGLIIGVGTAWVK